MFDLQQRQAALSSNGPQPRPALLLGGAHSSCRPGMTAAPSGQGGPRYTPGSAGEGDSYFASAGTLITSAVLIGPDEFAR